MRRTEDINKKALRKCQVNLKKATKKEEELKASLKKARKKKPRIVKKPKSNGIGSMEIIPDSDSDEEEKKKPVSRWAAHVRAYVAEHKVSYREALKLSKPTYVTAAQMKAKAKAKAKRKDARRISRKAAKFNDAVSAASEFKR